MPVSLIIASVEETIVRNAIGQMQRMAKLYGQQFMLRARFQQMTVNAVSATRLKICKVTIMKKKFMTPGWHLLSAL